MKATERQKAYFRRYYAKNRDRLRERARKRHDALRGKIILQMRARLLAKWLARAEWTQDEFEQRLAAGCEICGQQGSISKSGLCFDHDHETGNVRGILCQRCNKFLDWAITQRENIDRYVAKQEQKEQKAVA